MSALTDELPDLDETDSDDETHLWCCRPEVALCGIEKPEDTGYTDGPRDHGIDPYLCETCRYKEAVNAACSVPFCRLRWRITRWRSR